MMDGMGEYHSVKEIETNDKKQKNKTMKEMYKGEYKNNKAHGYGIKKYADGNVYMGMWENGRWNGPGVKYENNGDYSGKPKS